ncbi:UDP-glucuronate decarboxylase [Synechococcus sp. Minos11]|nr:UDP-glucuronate decarboxylase [Synechococcus sp. Minos11]
MLENDGRVVSNFIVQALKEMPITIYGDGSQTRSFCYVSDLVSGLMLLMESNEKGPINLGNPNEITIKELSSIIKTHTNKEVRYEYRDLPNDDPLQRQPVITKAKELLDWNPVVGIDEGIKLTITDFEERMKIS